MEKSLFGGLIKEIRKTKKMTQKQLSEKTGFSQNTISNHENGVRSLGEKEIKIYANAFGMELQSFMELLKNENKVYLMKKEQMDIIKRRMDELNITEKELLKKTNISEKKIKALLNGVTSKLKVSETQNLCETLNISPLLFFGNLPRLETMDEYQKSHTMKEKIDKNFFSLTFEHRTSVYNLFCSYLEEDKKQPPEN